jgi:pilus assembly protein TadC
MYGIFASSYFLTNLITELKVGKNLLSAIKNCSTEGSVGEEYQIVLSDIQNGFSFLDALLIMNNRLNSLTIKRANSNLYNLYLHGTNIFSLKKLNEDLLLKQRIESKEFSGKMVVYSLVFIVVSAIVPAMFSSFILIGSFFMQISFSAIQIFFILVFAFPLLDFLILTMINSKTPVFLRN